MLTIPYCKYMAYNKLYNRFNRGLCGGEGMGIYPQAPLFITINPLAKLLIILEIMHTSPLLMQLGEEYMDAIAFRNATLLALEAPNFDYYA